MTIPRSEHEETARTSATESSGCTLLHSVICLLTRQVEQIIWDDQSEEKSIDRPRGAVKLELRGPENVNGIVADPKPDWSFDTLLLELNALEHTLNASSSVPVPFTKTRSREFSPVRKIDRSANAFVMHISDDELDDMDSDGQEVYNQSLVAGRRFSCDELSLSDSDESEYGSAIGKPLYLMDKAGTVEGALVELTHEHWLGVEDEIRNQISALETDLLNGSDKFTSSLVRVEKYTESRREMDKKLDIQYQRKIAEALDSHLTAVQREHEHRSQIEERKIRNDAAVEEAKRKEKALREEKMRQEKIKAEAEARLVAEKKRAEEAKIVALEVERSTVKEPAEKVVKEISKRAASAEVAEVETQVHKTDSSLSVKNAQFGGSGSDTLKKLQSAGNILHSAENALKLEEIRLQNYNELVKRNQALRSGSNMDFQSYERKIARQIKQTSGTKEAVRAKANELIKIFSDPHCPQSITIAIFAEKVISLCENPGSAAFALGHVIVLVASKFPLAMDLIIAEFHRACVYTVPKHITYSQSVFETKEAYKKIIGFREEDGKLESTKQYLQRLESYMKLYGALVQTQIEGVQNSYGLNEGWAWVARLLNALPANIYTAVALEAFLKMAGFALFKKYKSQFRKIMNVVSRDFVGMLKAQRDPGLDLIIRRIETYIETKQFLQEPEGWRLPSSALSSSLVPSQDYREPYYDGSNRFY